MKRRLLNVLSALSLLLCVAVVALSVRWRLGLNDQAYLHLSRTTIRIEAEAERRTITIARFLPDADDNARPVVAFYAGPLIDNPDEHYGDVGDVLAWSAVRTHFLGFAYGRGRARSGPTRLLPFPCGPSSPASCCPLFLRFGNAAEPPRARFRVFAKGVVMTCARLPTDAPSVACVRRDEGILINYYEIIG